MNNDTRKLLGELRDRASKAQDELTDVQQQLQGLADAEQEKFDNMPEGLQAGDKGQALESAAGCLSEAASACDSAAGEVGTAMDQIDAAVDR